MKSRQNLAMAYWVVGAVLIPAITTFGVVYEWNGGSGDWTNSANWTPTGIPGAGDAVVIGGGTVYANSNVTVTDLDLETSTLSGTGTVTITGQFNWSGTSTMSGGGTTVIAAGAAGELSGSGDHSLITRTLQIEGLFKHPGPGRLVVNSGSTIEIGTAGTYELESDVFAIFYSGGTPTFTNSGTLLKSGGNGESKLENIAMTVTGTGRVDCDTGTILFPSPVNGSGTYNATGGASITYQNSCSMTNPTFSGQGLQRFTGGTLLLTGTCSAVNNEIAGATLNGGHTLAGKWVWFSGNFSGDGITTIPQGSTLTLTGSNEHALLTRTLQVDGTFIHEGTGRLAVNSGATVETSATGLVNLTGDHTWIHYSGADGTIINGGTFYKSGGIGTAVIEQIIFNNNSLLDLASGSLHLKNSTFNNSGEARIRTGTLEQRGGGTGTGKWNAYAGTIASFTSGSPVIAQGATFEGSGLYKIAGATVNVTGVVNIPRLELASGTLTGNGTANVLEAFSWSGPSTMSGGGTTVIAQGATATLSGDNEHYMTSRTLQVAGTFNYEGPGRLSINSGSTVDITSTGLFDLKEDVSLIFYSGGAPTFTNSGTVRKSGGTGTATLENLIIHNNGLLDLASGSMFLNGGTFNNDGEARINTGTLEQRGGGTNSGKWNISTGATALFSSGSQTMVQESSFEGSGLCKIAGATVNFTGVVDIPRLELASGVLSGNGTVTVTNEFAWTGTSSMSGGGSTVIPEGTIATLSSPAEMALTNRALEIAGTLNHSGAGRLDVNSGSSIDITTTGTYDLQNDTYLIFFSGGGPTFTNSGTFIKSGGTGQSKMDNIPMTVTETGTVLCNTGTLYFPSPVNGTGTFNSAEGATIHYGTSTTLTDPTFSGTGLQKFTGGTLLLTGTCSAENNEIAGATLNGTHTLEGNWDWSSGNLSGAGTTTIAEGATLTLTGTKERSILTRTLKVDGTFVNEGTGRLDLNSGSTVDVGPTGLLDIKGDQTWIFFSGERSSVNIDGTLRKSGGTGDLVFNNITPVNGPTGRIESLSGTIKLSGINGGGTLFSDAGAQILIENNSNLTDVAFEGEGIHRLTGGTITLNGNCSASSVEIDGANIAGTHTLHGTWHWNSGQLVGPGTTTIASDGTLRMISDGDHVISNRTVRNSGLIEHVGTGRLVMKNQAVLEITRQGVVDIQTPCQWVDGGGTPSSILNNGTIIKSTADGSVHIGIANFTGNGKNIAPTGWLIMKGNWLFHPDQGIIYLSDASPSGFLLYDFRIQCWGWSSEALYPYIYWYGRFNLWSHYSTGHRPDGRWFFDITHEQWLPETDMLP